PTKPEGTDVVKGKAARLGSTTAAGQFAAGSLFTGDFGKASLSPLGAELDFGRPFTERPSQLTGYFKYAPGSVTHSKLDYVPKNTPDSCSIYIALTDWEAPFAVNTGKSQFVDFKADYIIAYGELDKSLVSPATAMDSYQPFTIDILYRDLTRKPKYILIVCSSSKYGDYFTGSTSSVLLLDEFDLIYGEPKVDTKYIQN
ncbi:MAG: PCMD domain-containing protein, partial [Bacteroides sp.]